jgi:endogenous inhibitor of DNA gyrase (YacG/DUF329 family)
MEVAIGMEPLTAPCPQCGQTVFYSGYYCDDCGVSAMEGVALDADFEPDCDDEESGDDEVDEGV